MLQHAPYGTGIAAFDKNGLLGNGLLIPWAGKMPRDQQMFKRQTSGHAVLMGKNTWLGIPDKYKPLPDRDNFIISNTLLDTPKGTTVFPSIDEAFCAAQNARKHAFIAGGHLMYKEIRRIKPVKRLLITRIDAEFEGDVFFPMDIFDCFELVFEDKWKPDEKNIYPATFEVWTRRWGK